MRARSYTNTHKHIHTHTHTHKHTHRYTGHYSEKLGSPYFSILIKNTKILSYVRSIYFASYCFLILVIGSTCFRQYYAHHRRFQWPRGLSRRFAAAHLLRSWVRISSPSATKEEGCVVRVACGERELKSESDW